MSHPRISRNAMEFEGEREGQDLKLTTKLKMHHLEFRRQFLDMVTLQRRYWTLSSPALLAAAIDPVTETIGIPVCVTTGPQDLTLEAYFDLYALNLTGAREAHSVPFVYDGRRLRVSIRAPEHALVASLDATTSASSSGSSLTLSLSFSLSLFLLVSCC